MVSVAKPVDSVEKTFTIGSAKSVGEETRKQLASTRQTILVQALLLESLYERVAKLEGMLEASQRTSEVQARLIEALQGELSLWRGGVRRA